jgi:hypothetical protein
VRDSKREKRRHDRPDHRHHNDLIPGAHEHEVESSSVGQTRQISPRQHV